jgi:hypothetical protein
MRREFSGAIAGGAAGVTGAAKEQERPRAEPEVRPRKPKAVVKLFKVSGRFPNGVENTREGVVDC